MLIKNNHYITHSVSKKCLQFVVPEIGCIINTCLLQQEMTNQSSFLYRLEHAKLVQGRMFHLMSAVLWENFFLNADTTFTWY